MTYSLRISALLSSALFAALLVLSPGAALGQHTGGGSHSDPGAGSTAARDSIPLYDGLGALSRTISTSSEIAQRYFDQGMRLAYGFGHGEAVRSFREAQHHDPACAACFWGEAWALGPNINSPMRGDAVPLAVAAAERALELSSGASAAEQALIRAMLTRYADGPDAASRAALDSAYARAMDEVEARFPEDLEVLTLTGEAHMVLRPWSYWTGEGGPEPGVARMLDVLERALALDIGYPGACHLYIHLVEASRAPERAAACADLLPDVIPGVSHIPHMPSHIFMRIGRYGDAVRGNQRAWIADQRADFDGTPGVYPTHNLHMLSFAASHDGQSAVAIQAARDLARLSTPSSFYLPLILVRFGRWDEILELPVEERSDFLAGAQHYARGLARLRSGDTLRAEVELQALKGLRLRLPETARFRGHLQSHLLGMAEGVLAGEILAAAGQWDAAIAAMEAAVALEDGLSYDEPEPWPVSVRHHFGALLLDAGRAVEAERVYRDALAIHPLNGWSFHGLATSLRAQGRDEEAAAAEAAFQQAWARADIWIAGSRF